MGRIMTNLKEAAEKQNPYQGDLNTDRIKTYKELSDLYNVPENVIRDIFCAGIDWYKSQSSPIQPKEQEGKVEEALNEVARRWHENTYEMIGKGSAFKSIDEIILEVKKEYCGKESVEGEVIDFAVWYSGMEREKVEKSYERYLIEHCKPKTDNPK